MKKRVWIITAGIVLLLGVLWVIDYYGNLGLLDRTNKAAVIPGCDYSDKKLCGFLAAWTTVERYSVESTTVDKAGKKTQAILRVQGNDRFQLIGQEGNREIYNWVSIGPTNYAKDYTDNVWWKQTVESEETVDDFAPTIPQNSSRYKYVGIESCQSLRCWKYQLTDQETPDLEQLIWFDEKSSLLRQMRITEKDGQVTELVFRYNEFTIEEPTPTKDAKGEILLPALTEGAAEELRTLGGEASSTQ